MRTKDSSIGPAALRFGQPGGVLTEQVTGQTAVDEDEFGCADRSRGGVARPCRDLFDEEDHVQQFEIAGEGGARKPGGGRHGGLDEQSTGSTGQERQEASEVSASFDA
jgi:hypothetical protein